MKNMAGFFLLVIYVTSDQYLLVCGGGASQVL